MKTEKLQAIFHYFRRVTKESKSSKYMDLCMSVECRVDDVYTHSYLSLCRLIQLVTVA